MGLINLLVFGKKNCYKCFYFMKTLDFSNIDYTYIDIDDVDNEKICEDNDIDRVPHVQIIYNGDICFNSNDANILDVIRRVLILKNDNEIE